MTRDNEIANAASEAMTETLMLCPIYEFSPEATDLLECAYIKGAEWADSHPSSSLIVKVWNLATKTAIAQLNKEIPYFKFENEIKEYIKKHIRL